MIPQITHKFRSTFQLTSRLSATTYSFKPKQLSVTLQDRVQFSMTSHVNRDRTSLSLLNDKDISVIRKKSHYRFPYIIGLCFMTVSVLAGLCVMVLCLDITQPLRCLFARTFNLHLMACDKQYELESLNFSSNITRYIPFHGNNTSENKLYVNTMTTDQGTPCAQVGDGSSDDCDIVKTLTAQDYKYISDAEKAWETAWEILHDENNWQHDKGKTLETGRVYSKAYKGIGRVSKLEAYVDLSPEKLLDLVFLQTEDIPNWQSTVAKSKILERITANTDIHYMVTKPLVGGIISSRDYVTVRYWTARDNVTMSVGTSITHPDAPVTDSLVRGIAKPSGFMYVPVPGDPNKCLVRWSMSTKVGGWIPQWAVDQALASTMMDFLHDLRRKIESIKENSS